MMQYRPNDSQNRFFTTHNDVIVKPTFDIFLTKYHHFIPLDICEIRRCVSMFIVILN